MNADRFRLVYSQCLGMFVPVAETTKAQGRKSKGKRVRSQYAIAAAMFSISYSYSAVADPPAVNALPTAGVISSGAGSINTNAATAAMTVNQTTKNMIVNWGSFNIGAGASVNFIQPGATSAVLNRVGASGGLSQIYGNLTANGQVYLINPNGILFGNGATVNVNSLIASSLNISDNLFDKGFLSLTDGSAAFSGTSGFVQVDNGATLTSASSGKIMMFAPNVLNNGLINTPDGQTLLAAGQKVYLAASSDSNLRGLLVEVDNGGTVQNGTQGNANLGTIIAERGNVTLAGIAVNQHGRIKATTSVNANGSIRLQARDTVDVSQAPEIVPTNSGNVILGEASITEVLPELSNKTTVLDSVDVKKSSIEISGQSIHLQKDALVVATGGNVTVSAGVNPSLSTINGVDTLAPANTSRIYMESGSRIDVSGVGSGSTSKNRAGEKAEQLSASSTIVVAELRSPELADSPLQRDGILKNKKVYVDSQLTGVDGSAGTSVANVSGYVAQIGHNVGERLATGGKVKIQSEGDIVMASGATIDVSGGKVDYLAGAVTKTRLLASNGQSYDIANASKDLRYVDIQNVTTQQQAYTSGKDAGSVSFSAPAMVLKGALKGDAIAGARQRTLANLPKGATLEIGQNKFLDNTGGFKNLTSSNILHSDIVFDGLNSDSSVPSFLDPLSKEQKQTLQLGTNFTPNGFSNLRYYADGQITVKEGVKIETKTGGNLVLNASGVDVQGKLTARSGSIDLSAKQKDSYVGFGQEGGFSNNATFNVEIGSQAKLDVSGLWVNDKQNAGATEVIASKGGSVSISATAESQIGGNVLLKKGSDINASGGAWLDSKSKLTSGDGGEISLAAGAGFSDSEAHIGKLVLDGTISADSMATGGALKVTSGSVTIGNKALSSNGELLLDPNFFRTGGFNSYTVNSYEGLTLQSNTTIAPAAATRILNGGYAAQDTGADIRSFSRLQFLPDSNAAFTRKPTNLTLNASTENFGNLLLDSGSKIVMDNSAKVSMFARRDMTVLGSVLAPSGTISMTLGRDPDEFGELVSYLNNQSLWLGANSVLDVSGSADTYINQSGFNVGSVKDAGSIVLDAKKGVVVAENGATLNLNGQKASVDLKSNRTYVKGEVASKGGNLSISAREGVLWDASVSAKGGSDKVAGGNFSLSLYESGQLLGGASYPSGPREIVLQQSGNVVPTNLIKGAIVNSQTNGKAYAVVDKLNQSGFDNITLESANNIRIAESVNLSTRGSLTLNTPNVIVDNGAKGTFNTSYFSVGNDKTELQNSTFVASPIAGTGELTVNANYIDLFGNQSLSGASLANFISKSDIQLRGVLSSLNINDPSLAGGLKSAGDMTFNAGRIYPSTLSKYTLSTIGTGSTIAFKSNSADSGVPFSVLGTLNVEAANIMQDGVLRAPFGVINLKATDQLTLGSGSLTSVSAEGKTLPFGTTTNGKTWNFDAGDGRFATINALPEKSVNLDSKKVNVVSGSKIDVSGGGDLSAYEFTVGTGGSQDVLAEAGVFAIMPEFKAGYLPGNSESNVSGTLKAGDSIYLSGGNGLAAGNYVLLPAHYALLPGGYSVKAVAGKQDFTAQENILNRDGSMLVSGYLTQHGGLSADSRSSGFLVASGNIARTQSEFTNTSADKFFNKIDSAGKVSNARLPADAGRVAISAATNLVLDGDLIAKHASIARGAEVDISSDKIAISGDGSQEAGFLTLSSEKLNSYGAESIVIGGKRANVAEGTQLNVTASNVKVIGGASLTGQEIMLAATDTVSMASGTSVTATGGDTKNIGTLIIGNADTAGSGDGALIRVSTGKQPDLVRKNVSQTKGSLDVQAGAKVSGTSVIADATKSNTVNGDIALNNDGAIRIGAPKISFGSASSPVTGLQLDNAKLAALGNPSNIQLKSYSTIDFYGNTSVGNANLKTLTLESSGLAGYNNSGNTVTLTADTVKFSNPDSATFVPAGTLGTGTLEINAGKAIGLGNGTFSTDGFSKVNLKADQVIGEAKGTLDVKKGDLTIDAGRITASGLSDTTIQASGKLETKQHTVAGLAKAPLGGKLTLAADTITHGGIIDLPSGTATLKTKGTAGGNSLELKAGSQINAKGSAQMLGTVAGLADGGKVNLQTANGNLRMESGAVLDVSATGGAAAGSIAVNTAGSATLAGTLNGGATAGNGVTTPKQGSFELSASELDSFNTLNTELERGKFNESRNVRVAKGDLNIAATDTVTAHNFTLTTDNGNLNVAGKIDATASKGGIVKLNAGQLAGSGKGNITLASTAVIDASATTTATEAAGSKGDGGKVLLNTTTESDTTPSIGSRIVAALGSVINVSGKGLGSDGKVTLRAPRLGMVSASDAGTGIAISEFKSTVTGSNASIVAEGVKVYKTSGDTALDSAAISTMQADNASYLANANTIASNLGLASDKRFVLAAGDEVRSTGDITVASDINLQAGGPGALTLRAQGDVNVNANISAGFTTADTTGELTNGGAWTYRIAAGADTNSADVLATNNAGKGDFTLGAGNLIRTGTGDIEIATGGSFSLATIDSAIYTAGEVDTKDYSQLGRFINPTVQGVPASFAVNGGDINIISKSNIKGVSSEVNSNGENIYQLPADWLFRSSPFSSRGARTKNTSWWASFGDFKQNIGALSGGDVNVSSYGDISDLSAVTATNGRVFGSTPANSTLIVNGGGDLTVQAGGSIYGGLFMVDKGIGNIRADGSLSADVNNVKTSFALGDASIDASTRGALNLLTVFNPLSTRLSEKNYISEGRPSLFTSFTTYEADNKVSLTSTASGVSISPIELSNKLTDLNQADSGQEYLKILPGTLNAIALGGDFILSGNIGLMPAANGDLKLAASGSINFNLNESYLAMSDIDTSLLPTAISPLLGDAGTLPLLVINDNNGIAFHAEKPIHANDKDPVVLYAGKDIVGTNPSSSLIVPKKANIFAGNDIRDFSILGQNLSNSDVTTIKAGNDFIFTEIKEGNNFIENFNRIDWGGPGYLEIMAGRNVNLNTAYGVLTSGNLRNPNLPEVGATISVLAGALNADQPNFIEKYLNPTNSKTYTTELFNFVKKVTDNNQLIAEQSWTVFQGLDSQLKGQFANFVFLNELKQSGIDHNNPNSNGFGNYKRGYEAIEAYFPNDDYQGSLDIAFSQIKTLRGGDINVMLPGGDAVIGLPKIPPGVIQAKDDPSTSYDDSPSLLGLVTVNGGALNVFAKNNIDVAQSREFTLAGGDLLNWSTLGGIDAGKGAKTATSAPPPLVRTDAKGNTVIDLAGVVSGSGIGTLQTLPDVPVGDTYLIAPNGTVNAGDAGIRSSGNLLVAAQRVLGADNISVGGTSSGVPSVSSSNISFNAPASADANNTNKQDDQLGATDKLGQNSKLAGMPSVISVEVLSLGDEAESNVKKETVNKKCKDDKNKKDCAP